MLRASWQGSDDKGPVEFAGDSHSQPGIAVVELVVDVLFDRFNGSVVAAYFHQIGQFFNHIRQGTAYFLAKKFTGLFCNIGGNNYLMNSVCLHIEYKKTPLFFCSTIHPVMRKHYREEFEW